MTTKQMIEVMQHYADGGEIEVSLNKREEWSLNKMPLWNWTEYDYRIKPMPKYVLARDIKGHIAGKVIYYNKEHCYWATASEDYSGYILSCGNTETKESALERLIKDGWVKEATE